LLKRREAASGGLPVGSVEGKTTALRRQMGMGRGEEVVSAVEIWGGWRRDVVGTPVGGL
jgi:hypothetical protein